MYNLLIALAIASVFFVLGMTVTGTLVAGFVPGILGLMIAYFILARRFVFNFFQIMRWFFILSGR